MKEYISGILLLLIIDLLWVSFYMRHKYSTLIKTIQGEDIVMSAKSVLSAIFAYSLMVAGLVIFVIPNIERDNILCSSAYYGFSFGFIMYGLYNMTCMTVFKDWSISMSYIDMVWGGLLYWFVSGVSVLISEKF